MPRPDTPPNDAAASNPAAPTAATHAPSLMARTTYFRSAAWAAARRAIGTRNGEQLT